ncbi:MAG: STAS domain-containing protein [Ramlibacter sp.]|jgi:anti-anti-sigma factor
MNASSDIPPDIAVVRPQGRLDSATSPAFEVAVLERIEGGSRRLVLDLSEVGYISSAGLRVILAAGKKLRATQGKLVLCGLRDEVRGVFEMSGFLDLFPVTETAEQALAQL